MLLIILGVLLFLCTAAFGIGCVVYLHRFGSDHDFVPLSSLLSVIGMVGMLLLLMPSMFNAY